MITGRPVSAELEFAVVWPGGRQDRMVRLHVIPEDGMATLSVRQAALLRTLLDVYLVETYHDGAMGPERRRDV